MEISSNRRSCIFCNIFLELFYSIYISSGERKKFIITLFLVQLCFKTMAVLGKLSRIGIRFCFFACCFPAKLNIEIHGKGDVIYTFGRDYKECWHKIVY